MGNLIIAIWLGTAAPVAPQTSTLPAVQETETVAQVKNPSFPDENFWWWYMRSYYTGRSA